MALVRNAAQQSSTHRCSYHVFLSFRGEDTRKTFTDHLYTAFVDQGFRTFRDDDELERGEDIKPGLQRAIQQSRSSVIVFSKDYASSRWCLDELLMILQRRRNFDHVVLPVFYDVDPSEVRKQSGTFEEALAKHQKTQPVNKVKEWRAALTEVADLGGMVLLNQDDGYESKFIKKIVKKIGDKLSRTPLSVSSKLIGIHSRANKINLWVQDGSTDVGIHVIFGMSGIGKTTIAKHVYNLNFRRFEASSFIENIRETSEQPNGLVQIQKQLLHDILNGRKVKIHNASEGKVKIEDAIGCKQVLLVLDDVDHMEQLDALVMMRDQFYPGSKIIITTRRARLLKVEGVTMVHHVRSLKDEESLKLFCWYAFRQECPVKGYEEHTQNFVRHSAGLPLAIQVLGSSLFREEIAVWESALKKLEAIPHSEIINKLRISYDVMDKHDQEVFLHIACYFIGNDKDYTVAILDRCELFTTIGITNLADRCLLKVNANNKVVMHDMIRDMGRRVVDLISQDPGKRSRLWRHNDSFKVLREKNGTETIEGLELNLPKHLAVTPLKTANRIVFDTNAFARMHKLRILKLSHVQLTGCYDKFPTGLIILCWIAFPLDSIPFDFHVENLVVLEMQYSSLRHLLNGTKCFPYLKKLDLSHSHGLLATIDFSLCPNLEKLILIDCESLIHVHESIGFLKGLVFLNIEDCKSLRMLPKNMSKLKRLDTLIVSGCSNLDKASLEMIRNMKSLQVLEMDRIPLNQLFTLCGEVTVWSNSPCSLQSLSLNGCNLSDDAFPMDFSSLSLLRRLNLSGNPISHLPNCVKGLTRLDELSFSKCLNLKSLVHLPKVRSYFTISGCTALERITFQPSVLGLASLSGFNYSLFEWQYKYKLEPIGAVDVEILNLLGLENMNFKLMPTIRMCIEYNGYDIIHHGGIQGLHEYNCTNSYLRGNARKIDMFSTFFPGNEVPGQFSHKSKGSSPISLTVPMPLLHNLRIRGFNIFVVYATSINDDKRYSSYNDKGFITIKVMNESNDDNWFYTPVFRGIPGEGEDMVWLSHWNMKNQIIGGHQMAVSLSVEHRKFRYDVKEWGIQVVQEKQEIILCTSGEDLSRSHEPLPGTNLLSYEPDSVEVEDKQGEDKEAKGDLILAPSLKNASNNRAQSLGRWKVLLLAVVIISAAISVAHHIEESDLDNNLAEPLSNTDNEEQQNEDGSTLVAATGVDGIDNRGLGQGCRKWKVLIVAAVFLILSVFVHPLLISLYARERMRITESILVPT